MVEEGCPVCEALEARHDSGTLLVRTELIDARHAEVGNDDPAACAGRIDIRPRRHVSRWARLTPAEHGELDRLTVALSIAVHRVAGAISIRPEDVGHESLAGHLFRRLQPEYPAPRPAWLADPRWQDPGARQQAVQDLVERLRAHLDATPLR